MGSCFHPAFVVFDVDDEDEVLCHFPGEGLCRRRRDFVPDALPQLRGRAEGDRGRSMRLVDEAFGRGIGERRRRRRKEEGGRRRAQKGKEKGGGRGALFSRPLWQCGGAKEVSPRAELFSKQQQQLDISAKRAAELLPASDEVELEIAEGEEIVVHGVACWLRFEAAAEILADGDDGTDDGRLLGARPLRRALPRIAGHPALPPAMEAGGDEIRRRRRH